MILEKSMAAKAASGRRTPNASRVWMALSLCLVVLLSSCGYQVGQGNSGLPSRYSTISVPYVKGDIDGTLTSAIIKEIVRSGAFAYQYSGGALILNVRQVEIDEDNIGFRYDRKKRGERTKDIIPVEARITILVEVWVTEAISCTTVLGPVLLSASVDYDHDYYSSRDGVNIFSLGQLTDLEEAYDAVQTPLNREIAEKIADYISQSW
jgi:hypothetical protein